MKKRIGEINILRGIAGLAVVMVHISAIAVSTLQREGFLPLIYSIINRGLKFTTPTFIFISGLLLLYKYKNEEINYPLFLYSRFRAILIPYISWSLVYYLYFVYTGIYIFSIKDLVFRLLLGSHSYHLYFIVIILQFYLLFGLFLYGFKRLNPSILLLAALVINLVSLKYLKIDYSDRIFLNYIFYFALGCYWGLYIEKVQKLITNHRSKLTIAYIIVAAIYIGQFYLYNSKGIAIKSIYVDYMWLIFSFVSITFLSSMSKMIDEVGNKRLDTFCRFIGRSSFSTYLMHPFVLYHSDRFIVEKGIQSTTLRFLLNVIIVYGIVYMLNFIYISSSDYIRGYYKTKKATTSI